MYRLTLLGSIELRDEHGTEQRGVLAQPKRLALLAYLAMRSPGAAVRRDHLLGLFWPDLPQERARKALNKAVHFLRQELGDEVITSRNLEEIAVDAAHVWCDAVAFTDLLREPTAVDGLELYRGDLLPGFYLSGAEGFETWLEQERPRLRRLAARAAHEVAEDRERLGKATTAVHFARRAVDLAENDERTVRQLLELLDRLGDRAGALYAYDRFAKRLASEFEASPAIETQQLVERIRSRADANGAVGVGTNATAVTAAPAPFFESPAPTPHSEEFLIDGFRERGYAIERLLARGGMARIYLARDLKRDRLVALKIFTAELGALKLAERFEAEIKVTANLQHPNILPLFDSGAVNGVLYYAMPYVDGESLRARLEREKRLSLQETVAIVRTLSGALMHAHRRGVVHRDIKPENILFQDGQPLLADFGIALAVGSAGIDRLTATGLSLGTPQYMSPEQTAGDLVVGTESDIYSLASVTFELLSGQPPFTGPNARAVFAKVLVEPPPPIRTLRDDVPVAMEDALLRALAKHPEDRFHHASEFADALSLARSPGQRYPAAVGRLLHGRPRIHRALGLSAIILTAVVAYVALRPAGIEERRVLVGLFADRSGDPALAALAGQASTEVVRGLASTGIVQPVDARGVASDPADARDLPRLRRLARGAGAGSVVSGSFTRRGDSLEFEIHLTDAATGGLLRPVLPLTWPGATPSTAVAPLAQRVMAAYAAHLDPQFRNYAAISQPTSYDAYREFDAGRRLYWEESFLTEEQFAAMFTHFRAAIALDSAFMAPRVWVATGNAILMKCTATDSVADAFQVPGARLLPADQAAIDFVVAFCHHDTHGAYVAAQQLYRSAPDFAENVWKVAFAAMGDNRPREVLTCLERLERIHDGTPQWRAECWNLMMKAYHQLGQYREAIRFIDRMRVEFPDDPLLERYEMRQWAAMGDVMRVNTLIDRRLEKSSRKVLPGEDMMWIGEELRSHGQLAAGRALCERGVVWYRTRPSSERAKVDVRLLYCAERWDEARAEYERLAEEDSSATGVGWHAGIIARIHLGALAVRRDDSAEVARIDQWLAERDTLPVASYGRAVLAGLRGDWARALPFFQFAWERGAPGFEEGHSDPLTEPLRAYPPIRAFIYSAK